MTENLYTLPNNWRLTKLKNVTTIFTGNSINEKVKQEKYFGKTEGLIYIATKDVGFDTKINYDTNIKIPENEGFKIAPANTALLCIEGGSAGKKVGFTNQPVCFVNKLCAFVSTEISSKFIFYFLQSQNFINQFNSKKHGLIGGVPIKNLSEIEIPLPPLAEQKRIVAVLDSLFEKLDTAQNRLQSILMAIELHKVKLYQKAFEGALTAKFRENNGISKDDWQIKKISDVCKSLIYGTSKKSKSSGKIIVIRMGNLQNGKIDWKDLAYSDDEGDIEKYNLSAGDVLFNRTNSAELVGKTSIYCGEYPAIYAGYLIKLDYDREILCGEFLNYILNSPNAKKYCHQVKTDGVNQSNINAKKIGAYIIPLPPLSEQKEIARLLDSMLTKENRVKEIAEKSLQQIDALKKNILARAFRGELGTNNLA